MRPEYPRRACMLVRARDAWVGSGLVSPSSSRQRRAVPEGGCHFHVFVSLIVPLFIHSFFYPIQQTFIAPLFCIIRK